MMQYDSDSDDLPEVERRFIPYTSTPADTVPDDSRNVSIVEEICIDCALVQSSDNIANLTSPNHSLVGEIPTCRMACLDHSDALVTFTDALCNQLFIKNIFHAANMPNLKNNLKEVFLKILDKMGNGRLRFYCQMMERLAYFSSNEQDKVVTLLNEIASLIVDKNREQFEIDFSGRLGRSARKNLFRYMSETSNFLSLQAAVETLIIFYTQKINISKFLPESLQFLIDSFEKMPEDKDTIEYHHALANITRKIIIDVLEEKTIEIHKLVREDFMNTIIPTGRDLYLYFNKREKCLNHLVVFSPNDVYLETIGMASIKFVEADLALVTDHWKFTLESRKSWQRLINIKNEHEEICETKLNKSQDDESRNMMESQIYDENGLMQQMLDDPTERKMNPNVCPQAKPNLYHADKLENVVEDKDVADKDTLKDKIKAEFKINQEDLNEYWNPQREFYRTQAGRDWPMMYGSPCAVSIRNQHVSVSNSRKRNANFARLEGFCLICKAKHSFVICDNPFEENYLSNGTIEYKAVEDMIVTVSVEGIFHVVDSKPDITKPVHEKNKGKGLDLRGEERRLLGLKASAEGAASVYREGMAYLQKEQIESYNRTSVRSLPVIR